MKPPKRDRPRKEKNDATPKETPAKRAKPAEPPAEPRKCKVASKRMNWGVGESLTKMTKAVEEWDVKTVEGPRGVALAAHAAANSRCRNRLCQ